MKPVLQLLAASALSAGMVIGGVVLASAALAPGEKPRQFAGMYVDGLWTTKPVRIDRNAQNLERLPPRYASHVVMSEPTEPVVETASTAAHADQDLADLSSRVAEIDLISTSALDDAGSDMANVLPQQHVTWCSARYRSYDPTDNTYHSYSGEIRDCTSPYQTGVTAGISEGEAELLTVSNEPASSNAYAVQGDHVASCMQRYRSYRPSDNTYQPYGGGPRRQCELASF